MVRQQNIFLSISTTCATEVIGVWESIRRHVEGEEVRGGAGEG